MQFSVSLCFYEQLCRGPNITQNVTKQKFNRNFRHFSARLQVKARTWIVCHGPWQGARIDHFVADMQTMLLNSKP